MKQYIPIRRKLNYKTNVAAKAPINPLKVPLLNQATTVSQKKKYIISLLKEFQTQYSFCEDFLVKYNQEFALDGTQINGWYDIVGEVHTQTELSLTNMEYPDGRVVELIEMSSQEISHNIEDLKSILPKKEILLADPNIAKLSEDIKIKIEVFKIRLEEMRNEGKGGR